MGQEGYTRKIGAQVPQSLPDNALRDWVRLSCRLVTPMYGGGTQAKKVDLAMPIRVAALRGQWRMWWRELARVRAQDWGISDISDKGIRQAEMQLWGGASSGGDSALLSGSIFVRVRGVKTGELFDGFSIKKNQKTGKDVISCYNNAVSYALFPARPESPENIDQLLEAGAVWTIEVAVCPNKKSGCLNREIMEKQLFETLRCWANFGGVGARTRRGVGAVRVERVEGGGAAAQKIMEPVSAEEARKLGWRLVIGGQSPDALKAWGAAAKALADFRQGEAVGRNPGSGNRPGRSFWPEPDAIRLMTGQYYRGKDRDGNYREHKPFDDAVKVFPRALFGMPVLFHFKDRGDPADRFLYPEANKKIYERFPSPLIVRPYWNGGGWCAAALLLSGGAVRKVVVRLGAKSGDPGGEVVKTKGVEVKNVNYPPMKHGGGVQDPLEGFLNFFAQRNGGKA